jgi:SAM-dependent methyltransferase
MTDPHAKYVQRTLAGEEYAKCLTASEPDRQVRAAFQDLVLRVAPLPGALFDFGAGAGIDARFFAERGFAIEAYDADSRMREFFMGYCRDLIDCGRIAVDCSDYRQFVAGQPPRATGRFDLVIANFAPLNLIDDIQELFAKFHALTVANGKVLASVLSPYFLENWKSPRSWRYALRLWRKGQVFMPGPQAPHYLRRLANFSDLCAPHFRLSRAFRGLPSASKQHSIGIDLHRARHHAWLHFTSCRYMFLLFEKREGIGGFSELPPGTGTSLNC